MMQEDRTVARAIDPETTLLVAALRAAGFTGPDMPNTTGRGIIVTAFVGTAPGAETLQVKLQARDPLSGNYYDVAANTATTVGGFIILKVSQFLPNVAASASGQTVQASLPATWRIVTLHSGGSNWNYSIQYSITY